MAYIPKGYWRSANNLRLYIRAKEPDRLIPKQLEDSIMHFERLARLALEVDDARKARSRALSSGKGLDPRKQGEASLKTMRLAEAQFEEALDALRAGIKDEGPGIGSRVGRKGSEKD